MKIGILTIFGGTNYGNKLQNFALQKFLEKNDLTSETIRYTVKFNEAPINKKKKMYQLIKKYFSSGLGESLWNMRCLASKYYNKKKLLELDLSRSEKIEEFESQYIRFSNSVYTKETLGLCNLEYEKIVVGSDQVWNPNWQGNDDAFFLDFALREKRIAYAPSIGTDQLPNSQKERYSRLLNGFDRLSCREQEGTNLITKLCNVPCLNVVDPVFLLTKEDWTKLCIGLNEDKRNKGKYVVTYFLAGKSNQTRKVISEYARLHGLAVIDIYTKEDTHSKFAGIEEFLSLIYYSSMVFTDSFHGTAFSVIFGKQFVVCDRRFQRKYEKMTTRIEGLLNKLHIYGRWIDDEEWKKSSIDFDNTNRFLLPWINGSKSYLLSQINS